MFKSKKGFTLIELMIVVAIIGILAAIAIPKFAQLIVKGNEANVKGNLGAIRSALSIYFGDTEGVYPEDKASLASLTAGGKYMTEIPKANIPAVSGINPGHYGGNNVVNASDDKGGWFYTNDRTSADWGRVLVNCTHADTRSTGWTTY